MYNTDRRFQPPALHIPAQHALPSIAARPTTHRRNLLRTILEALSWLGEMRAVPFTGLGSGPRHDERPRRDY